MTYMYLRGRGPRFVTVCDRGGVKFVKSSVCKRYEKPVISKDYYYTNTIIILMFKKIQSLGLLLSLLVRPSTS